MSVVASLENPQAITSLFGDAIELSAIQLHEVVLHRDGPVLRLRFDIPIVPEQLPKNWQAGVNTTQLSLAAWGLQSLQIEGWASNIGGELSVTADGKLKRLTFNGEKCCINAICEMLRVENVSAYNNTRHV
jgi:Immunity protein 50